MYFKSYQSKIGLKLTLASILLAGAVALVALAGDKDKVGLELGDSIPMATAEMLGVDGEKTTIEGAAGEKGTLVIFSCNACPWVKRWEDRIAAIGNACQEKGVGVIVINSNDPDRVPEDGYEVMQARAEEKGFAFPYVVDATSDVARAFGAQKTPEVFLFDADGALVYHGAVDDNAKEADAVEEAYLTDALDELVAGKEIEVTQTKAMGCSIKFRPEA